MINDKQGREWVLQKLYDNGWRYYVKNIGGDVFLTRKKPVMIDNILDIRSGGLTKLVNAMAEIMPNIDECGVLNIAEELGIVDWSKIAVDTPILVDKTERLQVKRHFARFDGEHVYYYGNGRSSWTFDSTESISPKYVKLAEV